jgi:hypothetical protein
VPAFASASAQRWPARPMRRWDFWSQWRLAPFDPLGDNAILYWGVQGPGEHRIQQSVSVFVGLRRRVGLVPGAAVWIGIRIRDVCRSAVVPVTRFAHLR